MPRTRREQLTFPINVRRLTVRDVVDVTPGLRRVTLIGEQLRAFTTEDGIAVPPLRNEGFDDHVKIIVPDVGEESATPPRQVEGHLDWSQSSPGKDYTPRRWDPERGEIDLEFVRHGTGLASTWAERVQPGDTAHIAGPKASALLPEGVDWYLVGGDETALPAIGRLIDDLPTDARAQVFVEVADAEHEVPFPGLATHPGVELTWLHRGDSAPGTSDVLEKAVRSTTWWDGEVYAWFAGEATSLKPVRTHLKNDRSVPRDCLEVVGYWRRTELRVDEATGQEVAVEDDSYRRLHELLELSAPVAVRTAGTVGLFTRLADGPAAAGELAADLGLDPAATLSLVRYLAALDDVLTVADGRFSLAGLGDRIAEDDELLAELTAGSAASLVELSVPALTELVRTGRAGDLAQRLAADPALADDLREHRAEQAVWSAPSVVQHRDWSAYSSVTVTGQGAPEVAATLIREHPTVTVTASVAPPIASDTDAVPGVLLGVLLLDQLPDAAAADVLRSLAADRGQVVLAELVLDTEDLHDHDAELDLQLRVAFGSGVRTRAEWLALFAAAGLRVADEQDLGWDMRMWALVAD